MVLALQSPTNTESYGAFANGKRQASSRVRTSELWPGLLTARRLPLVLALPGDNRVAPDPSASHTSAMKLKKIDITYFRCFESISIPLQPDVNVFVGGNGAGKTAILDAIAVILWDVVAASGGGGKRERNAQNATLRPSDVTVSLDQSAGRPAGASQTRDFVHIKAWADQFQGVGDDRAESAKPDLEWQNLIRFIPPAKFYYENRQSDHLSKIYGYLENLWDANGLAGSKNPVGIPVVAYYRANRKLNATPTVSGTVAMSLERREAFKNALNAGVDYDAMCHWFYQRETHEIHKKLQYGHGMGIKLSELDSVRSAIGKVIDDVDRIAFEGTPPKLKITLRDKQKENASTLELDQLSDGYKNLLAWSWILRGVWPKPILIAPIRWRLREFCWSMKLSGTCTQAGNSR